MEKEELRGRIKQKRLVAGESGYGSIFFFAHAKQERMELEKQRKLLIIRQEKDESSSAKNNHSRK